MMFNIDWISLNKQKKLPNVQMALRFDISDVDSGVMA